MQSLRYGIEVEVREETIMVDDDGDTYLCDPGVRQQVERLFNREVASLRLVPGDQADPVLFIEWRYYYREDEIDRYTIDKFSFTEEELALCYRMGIL